MSTPSSRFLPPAWAFEFHGHKCPFMPLGFRMGVLALERLGIQREKDHTLRVFLEIGEGHPQMCMGDGIQVATGATFAKGLMEKTWWGKLAATFWYPGKTPVRFALKTSFLENFGKFEFFAKRKQGLEPSHIDPALAQEVLDWTLSLKDEEIFAVSERPEFVYEPSQGSFNKAVCTGCGEVVFERYVRMRDGKPYCIPCSGYRR